MAPTHRLLRATLPLRNSIASVVLPRRATLAPSVSLFTPSLRSALGTTTESDMPTPAHPESQPEPIHELDLGLDSPPQTEPTQSSSPIRPKFKRSRPPSPPKAPLKPPSRIRDYVSTLRFGTVVTVGCMDRTVRVCYQDREWDKRLQKYYPKETHFLVSDPRNSLREGDVIEFSSGAPKSRRVHHVVERILIPFGSPIEHRPAVMSREERDQERERRWAAKWLRRESRRLGRDVDLVAEAGIQLQPGEEPPSDVELIHRIFGEKLRVGRIKRLVLQRRSGDEA